MCQHFSLRRCRSTMPEPGIALVTGAGSGLGAVIAERLGRSGLTIAVNTRWIKVTWARSRRILPTSRETAV